MSDILIENGYVATFDNNRNIYQKGFVRVKDDRIAEVGSGKAQALSGETVIDATNMVVMPGFVNVHTHIQQYFRGFYEYNDDFANVGLALEKYRHPDDMDDLGLATCAEFIFSGCTTFQSMYTYQDGFAKSVVEAGNRAVLGSDIEEVDIEELKRGVFKYMPQKGQDAFNRGVDLHRRWHGKADGRIMVVMAPKATDLTTVETYLKCKNYAQENGLRITTHLSQHWREVTQVRKLHGMTPPQLLSSLGLLNERLSAAHCSFITREDLEIMVPSGLSIMHCRAVNNPFVSWIDRGITVGLGTDDFNHDMFVLFRQNLLGQRIRARFIGGSDDAESIRFYPARPTPHELLEMATRQGAKLLGMEDQIGSLEKGKKADIILIDMENPLLLPTHEPLTSLVLYGSATDIDTVLIDGKILKRNKKLLALNQRSVLARAQRKVEEILERFKSEHPEQIEIWKARAPQLTS
ncbi:MAG: amidohydrolase family protein [bacterium]|nr:amidohydrolase family protein [bacterium]